MGQVLYTLIGSGRMAKHTASYFKNLHIPFLQWSRSQSKEELVNFVQESTHALLLIKDSTIENFLDENPCLDNKIKIHFSGALLTQKAWSAHPLYSFPEQEIESRNYQKIPFIIEEEGPEFDTLLPCLPNPHFRIPREKKPYYHALCVLGDNFTTLLWQKFFRSMENEFKIPEEYLKGYLEQNFLKLNRDVSTALTGPFVRRDRETLEKDLFAMKNDECFQIFSSFIETYLKEKI